MTVLQLEQLKTKVFPWRESGLSGGGEEGESLPESRRNNRVAWKTNASPPERYRFYRSLHQLCPHRFFPRKKKPRCCLPSTIFKKNHGHPRWKSKEAFNESRTAPRSRSFAQKYGRRSSIRFRIISTMSLVDVFPGSICETFWPKGEFEMMEIEGRGESLQSLKIIERGGNEFFPWNSNNRPYSRKRWWTSAWFRWMRVERKLSRQEKRKFIRGKLARVWTVRQIHNSDNRTTRRRSVVDLSRCATRKSARPFSSKLEGSNAIPGEQLLSRTLEQRRNPFS